MYAFPKSVIEEIALQLSYSDIGNLVQTCKSFTWIISDRHFWHQKILSETDDYLLIHMINKEQNVEKYQCNSLATDLRFEYVKLLSKTIKTYVPGMEKFLKSDEILLRALRSKNVPLSLKLLNDKSSRRYDIHNELYLAIKYGLFEIIDTLNKLEVRRSDVFGRLKGLARANQEKEFKVIFESQFKLNYDRDLQTLIEIIINIGKILPKVVKSADESKISFFEFVLSKYEEFYNSFSLNNYNSDDYTQLAIIRREYEHHGPVYVLSLCMSAAAKHGKIQTCNLIQLIAINKNLSQKDLIKIYDAGLKSAAKRGSLTMLNHFIQMGACGFKNAISSACKKTHLLVLETLCNQPTIFQESPEKILQSTKSIVSSACQHGCQEAIEVIFKRLNSLDLLTFEVFKSAISRCIHENFPKLLNWICKKVQHYLSSIVLKEILRDFVLNGTLQFSVSAKNKSRLIALKQAKIEGFYTGTIPEEPPREVFTDFFTEFPTGRSRSPTQNELAFEKLLKETVWF